MMGTRSGDVDPSLVALLMREENMTIDDVMTLLNKKSGLMGVSADSLDTRVLMKKYDTSPGAKLAMDMFAYRVRKAVGSYVAARIFHQVALRLLSVGGSEKAVDHRFIRACAGRCQREDRAAPHARAIAVLRTAEGGSAVKIACRVGNESRSGKGSIRRLRK